MQEVGERGIEEGGAQAKDNQHGMYQYSQQRHMVLTCTARI